MRPGKKLKLRTEKRSGIDMARKGKPWYSDMAEYKPGYGMSHGKKENTIQTHGFYRPEDEERLPFAGENYVGKLLKRLGIDPEDTKEYRNMQESLEGPTFYQSGIYLNPMWDSGKRWVSNETSDTESRFHQKSHPFTPEFIKKLQVEKADREFSESQRKNEPYVGFDDSNTRIDTYNKNRKAFIKFIEGLSTRAYMERNAK